MSWELKRFQSQFSKFRSFHCHQDIHKQAFCTLLILPIRQRIFQLPISTG